MFDRIARICAVVIGCALIGSFSFAHPAGGDAPYRVLKTVTLGGEGGWDYLTADPSARRIFISRGTHVMVIDADSGAITGDIPDTPGVHGIALAPDLGLGFTSNGRDNSVTIFDLKTLKAAGSVKVGENPDAILYDSFSKRVFTFNGRSKDATAVDPRSSEAPSHASVAGTIPLGGKPEFAVADGKGRIFVNIEDTAELVAIDSAKLTVVGRWPLAPCKEPTGLSFDPATRRLFAGCHNKLLAVADADSGKIVATVPIGEGVDATAFDPATRLVFSSNGDGTLTIAHEDAADKFTVLQNLSTRRGARTMALDLKTHTVFLVTADFDPPAQGERRPRMKPDSFMLLLAGR